MVRVGGGWDTLEHYLDKHDPCRCASLCKCVEWGLTQKPHLSPFVRGVLCEETCWNRAGCPGLATVPCFSS